MEDSANPKRGMRFLAVAVEYGFVTILIGMMNIYVGLLIGLSCAGAQLVIRRRIVKMQYAKRHFVWFVVSSIADFLVIYVGFLIHFSALGLRTIANRSTLAEVGMAAALLAVGVLVARILTMIGAALLTKGSKRKSLSVEAERGQNGVKE